MIKQEGISRKMNDKTNIRFSITICMGQNHFIYTIIVLKSVCVHKLQVEILARSPREMSLTVRIV